MILYQYVEPYKNIIIGIILYFVFWGSFVFSMKVSVRKTVGKTTFKRILKEYKEYRFDRGFSLFLAIIGMLSFWAVMDYPNIFLSWEPFRDNELVFAIPFIFYFSSVYCDISTLMKAMSNLM